MTDIQPTNQDILDTILEFSTQVDQRFESIDQRFESIDQRFESIDQRFECLEKTIANLPDKAYLDDKLADLKGDLILMMRKGDERAVKLIGKLRDKAVFTDIEANELLAITPFPQV